MDTRAIATPWEADEQALDDRHHSVWLYDERTQPVSERPRTARRKSRGRLQPSGGDVAFSAPGGGSILAAFKRGSMIGRPHWLLVVAVVAVLVVTREASVSAAEDECHQMLLVVVPDWTSTRGMLDRYEREGGDWIRVGTRVPVTIGRSGCGWGAGLHPAQQDGPRKREGDGRSPAGVFGIGIAFGAEEMLETGLRYRQMTSHDWCIDVSGSPLYNRIVDDREVGAAGVRGSTEPMRRDLHLDGDRLYSVGFVIGHNTGCRAGAGSCIFAHPWKKPGATTAGCTAMDEQHLRDVLAWLVDDACPRLALLPAAEHRRVWQRWKLPPPEDAP